MQQPHFETQNQKILVEQIRLLYQVALPILATNLLVSIALMFGLWNVVSKTTLVIWMALMLLVIVARIIVYVDFRRHFKAELVQRYGLYFIVGTGLTALVWGIGGVLLFPVEKLEYQLFILFVLVGMGAGAVSSLTAYLPAFYAFLPISMLPIAIKFYFVGGPIHVSLAMMCTVYIIALSYFALKINRTLKQSLKLGFENIDLVKQLHQQKDRAERANKAKSKFLAAASHDLRQPLHALMLFTSVLDESIKYPKVRRVVDQIKSSVNTLQSLFNALLDISQLDAGATKVEMTDFYLSSLFKKLANDFDLLAREKGLSISWPICSYVVRSDPNLFETIMRNYISNAIRYTDTGEIRITCATKDQSVCIRVSDTGVGIAEAEQQAIFAEFYQLSNPERDRGKGLGLGLAIVQRTAALLGHVIEVESTPGQGSTFSIRLEQVIIAEQSEATESPTESNIVLVSRVLIIVVDDEASVREGTQNLLELWDCDVITAADQNEAMDKLRQQNRVPDGIIADYRLRENRTGIDAIHAIYAEYNINIPALIVTGDIAVDRLREVSSSGFQVLYKPVAAVKLRTFLRNIQLRKQVEQN
jgi:signal transduction histidine kinase/CheY-like chemotaxis protein